MSSDPRLPKPIGPGPFLLKADTYRRLLALAAQGEVEHDPRQFDVIERNGKKLVRLVQDFDNPDDHPVYGGGAAAGAFVRTYTDDTGNLMLQGGTVQGGANSSGDVITCHVADFQLLASGGTAPADGQYVYLTIDFTGTVDDGVLVPGCYLDATTSCTIHTGASLPTSGLPTLSDPGGTLYMSLGQWFGGKFHSAGVPGNIILNTYLGSYNIIRA